MFVLTIAIFLALVAVPVEGGTACCYPIQMEGVRYYFENQETFYFVMDFRRGYIFSTNEIGGPNETMIDMFNYKFYDIKGEECSESSIRESDVVNQCLEEDQKVNHIALLGLGDQATDFGFFEYKIGSLSIVIVVKSSSEGCFPIATQARTDHHSWTSFFYNIQTEISDPSIFSELEKKCGVKIRVIAGGSSSSDEDN